MFDRVQRGDPLRIRAETWNSILDVVERAQRVGAGAALGGSVFVRGYLPSDASATIKRFRFCHIDLPTEYGEDWTTHTYNTLYDNLFKLTQLDDSTETGIDLMSRLAIAQEDIAPGETGVVCISGLCLAYVNGGTDTWQSNRSWASIYKYSSTDWRICG